ncbi:MAG TPA: outer membrane lipoprotein chaperone LolA [Burkholderiales bacterium]|nr:outer membrane lipoprotein chaperone LolA [Burkholderiales bacterium]
MLRCASLCATLLAGALAAVPAGAGSIEKLHAFIEQTRSAKATFTQEVIDSSGTVQQQASGSVQFQRPGKFRWTYDKPYEQIIVGDGEKLWIYDKELNQVTRRNLDKAIGSSPAALLAGADDVDKYFSLSAVGVKGNLDWLEVKPYDEGSLFDKVRMGFRGNALEIMELHDHFGQKTTIRLSNLQRNPRASPDLYTFTVPKGADVVTE